MAWIPKDRRVVTVSNHAGRAVRAADLLSAKGFKVAGAIGAQTALDACAAKGFNVGVSVIDSGGVLKALLAKDGTSPRGVQSSTNKAVTALAFGDATSSLTERIKSEKVLADSIAANPNFNARAGGVLLKVNDKVIGAIGVGGARGSENESSRRIRT